MGSELIAIGDAASTLVAYSQDYDLVDVRVDVARFPRINATPRAEAIGKMIPLVYAAFLYKGQDCTSEKIRFIATALVDEIMADPHFGLYALSWYEIGRVIRRAVLGGAKELYGISVASLYAALVDYAKTEGHDACKRAAARKETPYNKDLPF